MIARLVALLLATASPAAADSFIVLQSTTSTQNSGLYAAILPAFEAQSGIEVRVVAVGTGQALANAANCDGDAVLVHARAAEDAFVAAGYGLPRRAVMANDFVLIGPEADPAGLRAAPDAASALQAIAATGARFASRGDDSGTHRRETALWPGGPPRGAPFYLETGQGMGATLNIAASLGAYTLTDRATWLSFANRDGLAVLHEGGAALLNPYGLIVVSPDHCPRTKVAAATRFADWLTGPDGQAAIAAFEIAGTRLFTPTAHAN